MIKMQYKSTVARNRKSRPPVFRLDDHADILHRIYEFAPDATILIDTDGRITMVNAQVESMFGYPRAELVGQMIEVLVPDRFTARHAGLRASFWKSPRVRALGTGLDIYGRRKDESEVPVDIMLSPFESAQGAFVLAVVRDVTERKKLEAAASEARETHLRELHHRVKNNLQVVSSLLFLQSTYASHPSILQVLEDSQARVKSIALIHEKLYRSSNVVDVNFGEYISELISHVGRIYRVGPERVSFAIRVENVKLDIDTAVPCGLIVNELLSNVLKHAFPADEGGEASIAMSETFPGEFLLVVSDNGIGLPEGFDWRHSKSLGLKLVVDLAKQLNGSVEIGSGPGATFQISWKTPRTKEQT